jgi:para-nitrobenzyl esterase
MVASFNEDDLAFGYDAITGAKSAAEYQAGAKAVWRRCPRFPETLSGQNRRRCSRRRPPRGADANLAASARACAVDTAAAQGVNVFIDEYTRRHPYIPGVKLADQDTATVGAYHTADIPYWFGTQDAHNSIRPTRNWTEWDRTLSKQMMEALMALANTGSPDTPAMPWKPWSVKNDTLLWFATRWKR